MKKSDVFLTEIALQRFVCPSPFELINIVTNDEKDALVKIGFDVHGKRHIHNSVGDALPCVAHLLLRTVERALHSMTRLRIYELLAARFNIPMTTRLSWLEGLGIDGDDPLYEDEEDNGYTRLIFEVLKKVVERKRLYRCHTGQEVLEKADLFCTVLREERRSGMRDLRQRIKEIREGVRKYGKPDSRKSALKQLRVRKLHKGREKARR